MPRLIVLEPVEYKDDISSCLFVKDFPGCPDGFVVVWNPGLHCKDCGQHIYEIVNRKVHHECRYIDSDGKDRPVLDDRGEKTYYTEDSYMIICPRCMTYRPDDSRIGEFDKKEMIVVLYDKRKSPDPDMLQRNRHQPALPPAPAESGGFLARWHPIPPEALAELDFYREDRKQYALSKMRQQAIKAAGRKSHRDRPGRRPRRGKVGRGINEDYTYGFGEQNGVYEIL